MRRPRRGLAGCLAPGESSFAWNVFNFPGATVASTPIVGADFAMLATTGLADAQPDFKLVVQSYTIESTAGTTIQSLRMTIVNQGRRRPRSARSRRFLLDDQGAPLDYSAAKFVSITLAPGESAVVVDPAVEFDGAGTRVTFSPRAPARDRSAAGQLAAARSMKPRIQIRLISSARGQGVSVVVSIAAV